MSGLVLPASHCSSPHLFARERNGLGRPVWLELPGLADEGLLHHLDVELPFDLFEAHCLALQNEVVVVDEVLLAKYEHEKSLVEVAIFPEGNQKVVHVEQQNDQQLLVAVERVVDRVVQAASVKIHSVTHTSCRRVAQAAQLAGYLVQRTGQGERQRLNAITSRSHEELKILLLLLPLKTSSCHITLEEPCFLSWTVARLIARSFLLVTVNTCMRDSSSLSPPSPSGTRSSSSSSLSWWPLWLAFAIVLKGQVVPLAVLAVAVLSGLNALAPLSPSSGAEL